MSSLRLMCFSHKQVCEAVPRSLFWAFRISFHPDWQIDNGFFNRLVNHGAYSNPDTQVRGPWFVCGAGYSFCCCMQKIPPGYSKWELLITVQKEYRRQVYVVQGFFWYVFISELLALICSYCQCSSISDLLCGCLEVDLSETCAKDNSEDSRQTFNTMFPSGLFKHILDYLKPYLLKDTWKKSPLARHVLVWCTLRLKVWGN